MKKTDFKYKIEHHLFLIQKNISESTSKDYSFFEEKILDNKDKLLNLKTRDLLFELEGLLRFHLKNAVFNKVQTKKAEKVLAFLKRTEDIIGKLDLNRQLSTHKNSKNKLLLTQKQKNIIFKKIKKEWTDIFQVQKDILDLDIVVEPKKVAKLLKKEILRIEIKIKKLKSTIYLKKYNHKNLEAGFHEWRRSIRWVSIYMQFYKELFFLKKNKKTPIQIKEEFKNSVFSSFPNKSFISIDEKSFYELSAYIYYSGKAKDKLEEDIILKQTSFLNREFIAQRLYTQFEKNKILKKIRKSILY